MAHGTEQRAHARALTPVFTRYATLLQATKDCRWQRLSAALCNSKILLDINLLYAPSLRHVTSCCINRFQSPSPIGMALPPDLVVKSQTTDIIGHFSPAL